MKNRTGFLIVLAIVVASLTTLGFSGLTQKTPSMNPARGISGESGNVWDLEPFFLNDLEGKERTLSDWKGKVIVLNFWASWCGPCQLEIPEFVRMQKKYGQQGLQIVGVGIDEKNKIKSVKDSFNVNYPLLELEPSLSSYFMARWGNNSGIIPYTVVIDRRGDIQYIHRGRMGIEEFEKHVVPLLP